MYIVNVFWDALDAFGAGSKDAVPKPGLLAVVVALPPALAMVKIVVFHDNLAVEHGQ